MTETPRFPQRLLELGNELVRVLQQEIDRPIADRVTREEDDEILVYAQDGVRHLCAAICGGSPGFLQSKRGLLTRLAFERWPWGNPISDQIAEFEHAVADYLNTME